MSPSTDNFIHSLVEMSRAFEELPKVQASLDRMCQQAVIDGNSIAEREATILRLKAEIDELHAKVREAEVAKDAAETMFLEADDRTSRALDFIKATFGNAGSLIQALEPPRAELAVGAEPKAEPEPVEEERHYASANPAIDPFHPPMPEAPLPSPAPIEVAEISEHYGVPAWAQPQPKAEPSPSDQSDLGFTPQTTAPTSTSAPADTPSENVNPTDENVSTAKHDRYRGQRYIDFLDYISLADWLAGGGTEDRYYYRP